MVPLYAIGLDSLRVRRHPARRSCLRHFCGCALPTFACVAQLRVHPVLLPATTTLLDALPTIRSGWDRRSYLSGGGHAPPMQDPGDDDDANAGDEDHEKRASLKVADEAFTSLKFYGYLIMVLDICWAFLRDYGCANRAHTHIQNHRITKHTAQSRREVAAYLIHYAVS